MSPASLNWLRDDGSDGLEKPSVTHEPFQLESSEAVEEVWEAKTVHF